MCIRDRVEKVKTNLKVAKSQSIITSKNRTIDILKGLAKGTNTKISGDEMIIDESTALQNTKVDAQTRRDYWLSKGHVLSGTGGLGPEKTTV